MRVSKIHVILFLLTVLTTFITGLSSGGGVWSAVSFSAALLFILGSHEMGHYFYGRKYGISITPPYFIPAPPFISPIGTFGAFIKIKSPISTKKALFDIGIAGPLAGIIASIPILIIGIKLSTVIDTTTNQVGGFELGSPLIFTFISDMFFGKLPQGKDIYLHPVAFAGWVGLFVTALNLIPSGQLDGGHIVYALFSKKYHRITSYVMIAVLLVFGFGTEPIITLTDRYIGGSFSGLVHHLPSFEGWPGWILWAVLLTLLGTKHPPTIHEEEELDRGRVVLGALALLIFIGCITPSPIRIAFAG
jgi:membrane-associated protease RseP (regulator of RpoE activity)